MSTKVIFLNCRSEVMNNELKVEKFLMMPSSTFKKKAWEETNLCSWARDKVCNQSGDDFIS